MSEKPVLLPGPDHPITVTPADSTVTIRRGGRAIATSDRALVLQEASYPAVYYVPVDDVEADVLRPSSHETYCPYKGEASYYSLIDSSASGAGAGGEAVIEDAVWSYRTPYDAVAEIANHVAFYPEHVEISAA